MPVERDSRFECGCCDAVVVYRSDCPQEETTVPTCVCGEQMRGIAEAGGVQKS